MYLIWYVPLLPPCELLEDFALELEDFALLELDFGCCVCWLLEDFTLELDFGC